LSLQLEAIRAGAGRGLLPCFLGDADPGLVRLTPPIVDLAAVEDRWLLVHPDLRTVPRIRLVMEWIRTAFRENRALPKGLGPDRKRESR